MVTYIFLVLIWTSLRHFTSADNLDDWSIIGDVEYGHIRKEIEVTRSITQIIAVRNIFFKLKHL